MHMHCTWLIFCAPVKVSTVHIQTMYMCTVSSCIQLYTDKFRGMYQDMFRGLYQDMFRGMSGGIGQAFNIDGWQC
jgi:hypothetical protein